MEVRLHDEPVPLGGPKQRQVLACLIAARTQTVRVDALAEDLWGDEPPTTAVHVISTYVSGLRKVLGDRITSDGGGHALVLRDGDVVDAWALEESVDRARGLLDSDPAAALALLPGRPSLGRPFGALADVSELVRIEADRLQEVQLQAAQVRIAAELGLGRHDAVLPELRLLCDLHRYHEGLHALRMLALYRAGRQVEALDTFRGLRDTLADELGVDPSAELKELELRILLQDDALLLEPPHVLPTPLSSLVGREQAIAEVVAVLTAHRLVTLVGPGGVGKTRLGIEAARASLPAFDGGTWWIDLAGAVRPDRVASRIAEVLGLPEQPGAEPIDALRAFFARRHALLVLDNCEHMLPDLAGIVSALLEGSRELTILGTSRHALGIPGERRIPVDPLGADEAGLLFVTRAHDAGAARGSLAGADDAISRICRQLDRLPLAIELAASRSTALSVEQIADRLTSDPTLHGVELAGVHTAHRTLDAAIEWGYDLLHPEQRLALERLAVFDGPFDLDAATAVGVPAVGAAGAPTDRAPLPGSMPDEPVSQREAITAAEVVAGLVDSSLLVVEPGADGAWAYRMLETVRSFGRARLAERGATEDARRKHALHHIGMLEQAGWNRLTPAFADWMPRLEASELEINSALAWALEHLPPETAALAAPGLSEYWFRRSDPVPAYRFGVRLLEDGSVLPPRLEASARLCAGFGGVFAGDIERATAGLDTAIDLLVGDEDWRSLVWALLARGQNATVVGELEVAATMGQRILEVCDRHVATPPRAYGYALLGEAEFLMGGDLANARRNTEQAIEGMRQLRDPAGLNIFGLGIAAAICAQQGDLASAERFAVEGTTLPGAGWRASAYVILGGWVLHPKGENQRAEDAIRRGVTLAHQMSLPLWVRHGMLMLARLAAQEERWAEAARLFGAAHPQPPWGQAPHWWAPEQAVRDALGADRFDALSAAGAALPLDQWMEILTAEENSAQHLRRSVAEPAQ